MLEKVLEEKETERKNLADSEVDWCEFLNKLGEKIGGICEGVNEIKKLLKQYEEKIYKESEKIREGIELAKVKIETNREYLKELIQNADKISKCKFCLQLLQKILSKSSLINIDFILRNKDEKYLPECKELWDLYNKLVKNIESSYNQNYLKFKCELEYIFKTKIWSEFIIKQKNIHLIFIYIFTLVVYYKIYSFLNLNTLYVFFNLDYTKVFGIILIFLLISFIFIGLIFFLAYPFFIFYDLKKNSERYSKVEKFVFILLGIIGVLTDILIIIPLGYLLFHGLSSMHFDYFLLLITVVLAIIFLYSNYKKGLIIIIYLSSILVAFYFPKFIFLLSKDILFSYTKLTFSTGTQLMGYLITKDKNFLYLYLEKQKKSIAIPIKHVKYIQFLKPPKPQISKQTRNKPRKNSNKH